MLCEICYNLYNLKTQKTLMKECFKNTHALTFPNEYCSKFLNGTNVTKLCKVSQLGGNKLMRGESNFCWW